jgi:hypothetical protein
VILCLPLPVPCSWFQVAVQSEQLRQRQQRSVRLCEWLRAMCDCSDKIGHVFALTVTGVASSEVFNPTVSSAVLWSEGGAA